MTVIDILFRVDEICKKYEKYDPEKQRELNAFGEDAFACLYSLIEADIDKALYVRFSFFPTFYLFFPFQALISKLFLEQMQKSEMVSMEKNRAAAVALSAEVRRIKARLMEEVPKLQKLAKKKV